MTINIINHDTGHRKGWAEIDGRLWRPRWRRRYLICRKESAGLKACWREVFSSGNNIGSRVHSLRKICLSCNALGCNCQTKTTRGSQKASREGLWVYLHLRLRMFTSGFTERSPAISQNAKKATMWHFHLIRVENKMKPGQEETVFAGWWPYWHVSWAQRETKWTSLDPYPCPLVGLL